MTCIPFSFWHQRRESVVEVFCINIVYGLQNLYTISPHDEAKINVLQRLSMISKNYYWLINIEKMTCVIVVSTNQCSLLRHHWISPVFQALFLWELEWCLYLLNAIFKRKRPPHHSNSLIACNASAA